MTNLNRGKLFDEGLFSYMKTIEEFINRKLEKEKGPTSVSTSGRFINFTEAMKNPFFGGIKRPYD